MRPSSGGISIAASTRKLDVDSRISLRYYYRIAENLLKQASIYREEKNLIDLYILLLRFSSLITETIPCHQDYQSSLPKEKAFYKKKLLDTLTELEKLKPVVQNQIEDLNRKQNSRNDYQRHGQQNIYMDSSLEWPPVTKQSSANYSIRQVSGVWQPEPPQTTQKHYETPRDKLLQSKQIENQIRKMSLSVPKPREETLSRHSILGPTGLRGQWQAPAVNRGIQYPSNVDLTPIDLPSLALPAQDGPPTMGKESVSSATNSILEAVLSLDDGQRRPVPEEPCPINIASSVEEPMHLDIYRQPSPPPVLADVQGLIPASSPAIDEMAGPTKSLQDDLVNSGSPLQLHVPIKMMEDFMRLAKANTLKNLETCGVLAGSLKNRKFCITSLIIPKQESTSDSCQTMNEEEIYDFQDKRSLFPLGWIHTHPTQSCFMSSIDLHTHYSYQIMLPEAIAIVMAPTDTTRSHGIFRLSDPGGITVIRNCQQRGFHPHDEPPDGRPIYEHCTHVYMNPSLKFDVVDLR
ncbi:AMSH-like ubiquitin thioesterase 1 [Nymphaea colorata]|nr:AMSH-like ubiquitin thioesterase 1 [Nymphaea colorata]